MLTDFLEIGPHTKGDKYDVTTSNNFRASLANSLNFANIYSLPGIYSKSDVSFEYKAKPLYGIKVKDSDVSILVVAYGGARTSIQSAYIIMPDNLRVMDVHTVEISTEEAWSIISSPFSKVFFVESDHEGTTSAGSSLYPNFSSLQNRGIKYDSIAMNLLNDDGYNYERTWKIIPAAHILAGVRQSLLIRKKEMQIVVKNIFQLLSVQDIRKELKMSHPYAFLPFLEFLIKNPDNEKWNIDFSRNLTFFRKDILNKTNESGNKDLDFILALFPDWHDDYPYSPEIPTHDGLFGWIIKKGTYPIEINQILDEYERGFRDDAHRKVIMDKLDDLKKHEAHTREIMDQLKQDEAAVKYLKDLKKGKNPEVPRSVREAAEKIAENKLSTGSNIPSNPASKMTLSTRLLNWGNWLLLGVFGWEFIIHEFAGGPSIGNIFNWAGTKIGIKRKSKISLSIADGIYEDLRYRRMTLHAIAIQLNSLRNSEKTLNSSNKTKGSYYFNPPAIMGEIFGTKILDGVSMGKIGTEEYSQKADASANLMTRIIKTINSYMDGEIDRVKYLDQISGFTNVVSKSPLPNSLLQDLKSLHGDEISYAKTLDSICNHLVPSSYTIGAMGRIYSHSWDFQEQVANITLTNNNPVIKDRNQVQKIENERKKALRSEQFLLNGSSKEALLQEIDEYEKEAKELKKTTNAPLTNNNSSDNFSSYKAEKEELKTNNKFSSNLNTNDNTLTTNPDLSSWNETLGGGQ